MTKDNQTLIDNLEKSTTNWPDKALADAAGFTPITKTDDWRPIHTAPRNGTIIEIRCTYGVVPWYDLAKWTDERPLYGGGVIKTKPAWILPLKGDSVFSEESLTWRPYDGTLENYTDPTGSFQKDPLYWRQAVAIKYGLSPNHFEKKWWQFWK